MSFQAVLRDDGDALIVSGVVGIRCSVLQGSANGTAVFVETHSTSTNANGLATLEIGGGTPVTGTFDAINWGNGPFFLRTETDPTGGTAYSITGVSPLLSVPYALFAANNSVGPTGPQGPQGPTGPQGPGACGSIRTGDGRAVLWTAAAAHGFGFNETSGSNWYTQSLDGPVIAALASDSSVVLYTATTAYGFGRNNISGSGWYVQNLGGAVVGSVAANARIVLYTATTAFGFGFNDTSGSNWYVQSTGGPVIGHLVAGNRIVVYTGAEAHGFGFNETSGSNWYTRSLGGTVVGVQGSR